MGKQIYLPSIVPLSSYPQNPKAQSFPFGSKHNAGHYFSSFNPSLRPSGGFPGRANLGLLTRKGSPEQGTSDQRGAGDVEWWQVWKPENSHLLPLKEQSNHQKLLKKKIQLHLLFRLTLLSCQKKPLYCKKSNRHVSNNVPRGQKLFSNCSEINGMPC